MIARRALVAAGAGALVAGCGAPDEPPPDAELLAAPLDTQLALADAYAAVGGRLGRVLGERARANAQRLRAAGALGSGAAAAAPGGGEPLEAALALERRAIAACLAAVGVLRDPMRRTVAADVMTGAAQHESLLLDRLGRDPLPTAFPDGRAT